MNKNTYEHDEVIDKMEFFYLKKVEGRIRRKPMMPSNSIRAQKMLGNIETNMSLSSPEDVHVLNKLCYYN